MSEHRPTSSSNDDGASVLGALPRSRPHRRSSKRAAQPEAVVQATTGPETAAPASPTGKRATGAASAASGAKATAGRSAASGAKAAHRQERGLRREGEREQGIRTPRRHEAGQRGQEAHQRRHEARKRRHEARQSRQDARRPGQARHRGGCSGPSRRQVRRSSPPAAATTRRAAGLATPSAGGAGAARSARHGRSGGGRADRDRPLGRCTGAAPSGFAVAQALIAGPGARPRSTSRHNTAAVAYTAAPAERPPLRGGSAGDPLAATAAGANRTGKGS